MLVLSRKLGQSIVIGDQIVITVVRLGRGNVQIGVEAPAHVRILRQEVIKRLLESGELDDDRWYAETRQRVGANRRGRQTVASRRVDPDGVARAARRQGSRRGAMEMDVAPAPFGFSARRGFLRGGWSADGRLRRAIAPAARRRPRPRLPSNGPGARPSSCAAGPNRLPGRNRTCGTPAPDQLPLGLGLERR